MSTPEFVVDQLQLTKFPCRNCESFLNFTGGLVTEFQLGMKTEHQVVEAMSLRSDRCRMYGLTKEIARVEGLDTQPDRERIEKPLDNCWWTGEQRI